MKEEIAEILELIGEIDSKAAVIVEGKKDKIALEEMGVKNIVTLKKPIYQVIEEVAEKHEEAVILTDLDSEGKRLYGKISSGLQKHGIKIDDKIRNYIRKNTKIRQIEGLKRKPLDF